VDIDTLEIDVSQIVLALALAEDTEDALEELDETPTPHFLVLAKAADITREILNRKWGTVIALAEHLMRVRKMSGEQLVTFLNETTDAVGASA
jgi:hypothetical protein